MPDAGACWLCQRLRFCCSCALLLLVATAAGQDHHSTLGLSGDATPLQVTLAYVNLTKSFKPGPRASLEARKKLVEVQRAFEAIGEPDGKEEALNAVNYWEHVRALEDDEELQHFTELQSNGSSRLRIIFVLGNNQRHWGILSTATRLNGRAHVAQVRAEDVANGRFASSFKLKQHPTAVIYDPISRARRTAHGVDGVGEDAQRLLDAPSDRVARVQELDAQAYSLRCGDGCDWALAVACGEQDLQQALRPLSDACQRLGQAPCFWLRLGRGGQWDTLAQGGQMVFAFRPGELVVGTPSSEAEDLVHWFQEAAAGKLQATALPVLPEPVDEPEEPQWSVLWRKFKRHALLLRTRFEAAYGKMDTEERTMLAGAVLCTLMLVGVICRHCCCRRAPQLNEEEALRQLCPVLAVPLQRGGGEKLGIGIAPNAQGGFSVTSVAEGALLERWNLAQPVEPLRVRKGDRIVSVSAASGAVGTTASAMQELLRGDQDVCLAVAAARSEAEVTFFVATVVLDGGLTLGDVAELAPPRQTWGGTAKDAAAREVAVMKRVLATDDGSCCLQRLRPGDRIVSVNGAVGVRNAAAEASPQLVVARWRLAGALRAQRFSVNIMRQGPEDRLGMHIRALPGGNSPQLEVLEVTPDGAVQRWNAAAMAGERVRRGDRIVAVNGQERELQKQLAGLNLSIDFERWVDDEPQPQPQPQLPPQLQAVAPPFSAPALAKPPAASSGGALSSAPSQPLPPSPPLPPPSASGCSSALYLLWRLALLGAAAALRWFSDHPALQPALEALRPALQRAKEASERLTPLLRSTLLEIRQEDRPTVAAVLLSLGLLLALRFLWYEVRMLAQPLQRRTLPQVVVALFASTLFGCGGFCMLTWAGVQQP